MAIREDSDERAVDIELPGDEEPLCSEEEFAQEVRELVADEAPQVFALVEEYGERVDGRIVAWGHGLRRPRRGHRRERRPVGGVLSVERAHRAFSRRRKIRLVWTSPAAARRPEQVADTPVSGDSR